MPPKKGAGKAKQAVDKAQQKKREQQAQDKTFGLKNKNKSKKVQKYVQQVSSAAKGAGFMTDAQIAAKRKQEKLKKEQMEREMGDLYKAVTKQTAVPKGADPKSVVCEFYKAGKCKKGKKCKFSHDVAAERKVAKMSLYDTENKDENMEGWDQATLEDCINKKDTVRPNATTIVCKFFIDAIETKKYGWLWVCPNGPTCQYQHKLPPGFILKSDKVDDEEDDEETLEEKIEEQRAQLDRDQCTPVTLENFLKWKEVQKNKKAKIKEEKRKAATKGNKKLGLSFGMSGRDLFAYNPELFVDDADAVDDDAYEVQEDEGDDEEEEAHNSSSVAAVATAINEDLFLDDDEELPSDED